MVVVKALSIDGTFYNIPVSAGSVSVDRTSADVRRTVSFTVNDPDFVPRLATDPLNIYGNHVYVYRGVIWNLDNVGSALSNAAPPLSKSLLAPSSLAYELVPLGVFRISDVSIDESTDGDISIEVSGSDISANISKNGWTAPTTVWNKTYKVPIGKSDVTQEQTLIATTVQGAIKLLINDRWPIGKKSVFGPPRFDFAGVADHQLTKPVVMGSGTASNSGSNSPWTDITGLAMAVGAELYVGADGAFTLRPIPDPNTIAPVWNFFDGDGGLLTKAQRKMDSSKAINYVIATGENTGTKTPLKSIAYDGDPASPTFYQGEFGRVIGREPGKKKLTTQKMVDNAANQYLNWFVGGDESIVIEGVVNPALDTGDVIRVRRKRVGIYNPQTTIAEITSDFPVGCDTNPATLISTITVSPTHHPIKAGGKLLVYTDAAQDVVVSAHNYPTGATRIVVVPFHPSRQYRKGTIILDPADITNAGSTNHFIDQMTIPLDLESAIQITARARRVGTKKDAIRFGEYSTD